MAENREFQEQAQRINSLVQKAQALPDKAARATALELLQEVMNLHASVLDRMLELASQAGDPGFELIEKFAHDPLISGLLVLYDLHPEDLDTRIARALDKVRPYLHSHGGDVEFIDCHDGIVKLHLTGSCNGCSGSRATLKTAVEQAIFEAAPEVATVVAEGAHTEPQATAAFVPLSKLQSAL
jgi:Fe-S cluster biogenesis protein NfuA